METAQDATDCPSLRQSVGRTPVGGINPNTQEVKYKKQNKNQTRSSREEACEQYPDNALGAEFVYIYAVTST